MVFIKYKKAILIVLFLVIDLFYVVFGNVLLNGFNFKDIADEYTYDEIFLNLEDKEDCYIISKSRYDITNYSERWLDKYSSSKGFFEDVKFKKVSLIQSSILITLLKDDHVLCYCSLNSGDYTAVPIEYSREEYDKMASETGCLVSSRIYYVFNKVYMFAVFKDDVCYYDENISELQNLNHLINQSNSYALLELENFDVTSFVQGDEYDRYSKRVISVFDWPYCIGFIILLVGEGLVYKRKSIREPSPD